MGKGSESLPFPATKVLSGFYFAICFVIFLYEMRTNLFIQYHVHKALFGCLKAMRVESVEPSLLSLQLRGKIYTTRLQKVISGLTTQREAPVSTLTIYICRKSKSKVDKELNIIFKEQAPTGQELKKNRQRARQ